MKELNLREQIDHLNKLLEIKDSIISAQEYLIDTLKDSYETMKEQLEIINKQKN